MQGHSIQSVKAVCQMPKSREYSSFIPLIAIFCYEPENSSRIGTGVPLGLGLFVWSAHNRLALREGIIASLFAKDGESPSDRFE
jgi:hypothetical protein